MTLGACLLAALALWSGSAAAHEPPMGWFSTEAACAGATVTVRSYCEVAQRGAAQVQANTSCTEQEVAIARPGQRAIVRDLLEREPQGEDFRTVRALRCVGAGDRHYLLLELGTGGSCGSCETEALMGLDGRWKRYGKRWLGAGARERRAIARQEAAWRKAPLVPILNTTAEQK